jgi:DNA polymerase-3 subunit epsilon
MTIFTHEIVRMERSATKNSGSPMWRCQTKDGERVNVFQHSDPEKDNTEMFRKAGYFGYMEGLKIGEAVEWSESPIWVVMEKDGDWWAVKDVGTKPHDAEPDVLWMPDLKAYRKRAVCQAQERLEDLPFVIVDVETTGLRPDDEIIAVAIIDAMDGEPLLNTLVCPRDPKKLYRKQKDGLCAADVTGIRPEQLMEAPTFKEVWPEIRNYLYNEQWAAYNAGFDMGSLDRECSNAGLPLLTNRGVFDAAVIAAEYLGNWNAKRQWFEMLKLGEAATQLGVMVEVSHQAGADAKTTYAILKAIADDVNGEPF